MHVLKLCETLIMTENYSPCIIEHIAVILCGSVHINQEVSTRILRNILEKEYRHYILMFLINVMEGTTSIEIKSRLQNKDLFMSKKRARSEYEYSCSIEPSPMSMTSIEYMKLFVNDPLFVEDKEADNNASNDVNFIRDRLFAGALYLIGVHLLL